MKKKVASLLYCLRKWIKNKRGAMKKEELGEKGKRAEFCEEEEKGGGTGEEEEEEEESCGK
jgi:hypothetical protein